MAKQQLSITSITYNRVKNLGNYENCRVEAVAVVGPDEDPADVIERLRRWVCDQLAKDA